jgi:hypothetical protein
MAEELYNLIDAMLIPKGGQPMSIRIFEIGIANFKLQTGDAGSSTKVGMLIGAITLSESNFYIKWTPVGNQKAKIEAVKAKTELNLQLSFNLKKAGTPVEIVFGDSVKMPKVKLKSVANSDGYEKIEIVTDATERKNMTVIDG